ncbi:hypothetical protein [Terrisporobacter sp.]|uniref:hypothetical protein n=1 Tax=Terrisporobacter sp. TaxID=1965305 RepID=UPI00262E5E57|nr:hypothetical protein [Terrisporobacter sp.]
MLKERIGSYSIIIDGTWGEISRDNQGVVEYGNIQGETTQENARNILMNFIVNDARNMRKISGSIKNWIQQFNDDELKEFRIAYVRSADDDTLTFLTQAGYTPQTYINSL